MIIVIEGCDGTGKTTLARAFERLGFHYEHAGPPPADADMFETYTNAIVRAQRAEDDVVFDRLHLGELVYGSIVRDNPRITLEQIRLINRLLFARGGALIVCSTSIGNIIKTWRGRDEYVQDVNRLVAIDDRFNQLHAELWSPATLRYDYAKIKDADAFAQRVLQERPYCPDGINGSPWARFLFIGERAGGPLDEAFFCDKRSSAFLNRCLWDAGYREHELAFTNALTMEGMPRDIGSVWKRHTSVRFVALGGIADRQLKAQGVPHQTLKHPQYVKRFEARKRDEYVRLLRAIREGVTLQ